MSRTVWLATTSLGYPEGGGNRWAYLNWALRLRRLGFDVVWLEVIEGGGELPAGAFAALERDLRPYGLDRCIAFAGGGPATGVDLAGAVDAELLLDLQYGMPAELLSRFPRTALVDLDPGMTQLWLTRGELAIPSYDAYFSVGEIGAPHARVPDCGLEWRYTPPCVDLDTWWPAEPAKHGAYTTVAHWWHDWLELDGELVDNSKRFSFMEFLELPAHTRARLELALNGIEQDDIRLLAEHGWRVREAYEVSSSADDYRAYIQRSRGEFSCAKPAYVRLRSGWLSDRTVCYLACGKPAVVQDTGSTKLDLGRGGLLRFTTIAEAAAALDAVEADYGVHSSAARAIATECFDASTVVRNLLEQVLP